MLDVVLVATLKAFLHHHALHILQSIVIIMKSSGAAKSLAEANPQLLPSDMSVSLLCRDGH